jgi:putative hemolysin
MAGLNFEEPNEAPLNARDEDSLDSIADHLLAFYTSPGKPPQVIGTYRLILKSRLGGGRFFTQGEFNCETLLRQSGELLELGRSCIHPLHRNSVAIKLLWRGCYAYVEQSNARYLFGCASFPGTEITPHLNALAYLHERYLLKEELRPAALPDYNVFPAPWPVFSGDEKSQFHSLPPLIKGYLRIGGRIGSGAVIDPVCNTVDVCMVFERAVMAQRYDRNFGRNLLEDA